MNKEKYELIGANEMSLSRMLEEVSAIPKGTSVEFTRERSYWEEEARKAGLSWNGFFIGGERGGKMVYERDTISIKKL